MSEMLRKSNDNREQNGHRDMVGRKSILQELAGLTVVVVAPGDDQTTVADAGIAAFAHDASPGVADAGELSRATPIVIYCEYSIDLALTTALDPRRRAGGARCDPSSVEPVQADALANATPERRAAAALHSECSGVELGFGAQSVSL